MTDSRSIVSAQVPDHLLATIDRIAACEGVARSMVLRSMIDMGLSDPETLSSAIARRREKAEPSGAGREHTEARKVMVADDHWSAVMSLRQEKDCSIAEASAILLQIGLERYGDSDLEPEQRPTGRRKTLYLNIPMGWIDKLGSAARSGATTRSALIRHLMNEAVGRWPEGPPKVVWEGENWDCAALVPKSLYDRIKKIAGDRSLASVTRDFMGAELQRYEKGEIRTPMPQPPSHNLPLRLVPSDLKRIRDAASPYDATFSSTVRWLLDVALTSKAG